MQFHGWNGANVLRTGLSGILSLILAGCLSGSGSSGDTGSDTADRETSGSDNPTHLLIAPESHSALTWQDGSNEVRLLDHTGTESETMRLQAPLLAGRVDQSGHGFLLLDEAGRLDRLHGDTSTMTPILDGHDDMALPVAMDAAASWITIVDEDDLLRLHALDTGADKTLQIPAPVTGLWLTPDFGMLLLATAPDADAPAALHQISLADGEPLRHAETAHPVDAVLPLPTDDRVLLATGQELQLRTLSDLSLLRSWTLETPATQLLHQPITDTVVLIGDRQSDFRLLSLDDQELEPPGGNLPVIGARGALSIRHNAIWQVDETGSLQTLRLPAPPPEFHAIDPNRVSRADGSVSLKLDGKRFFDGAELELDEQRFTTEWQGHDRLELSIPVDGLNSLGSLPAMVDNPGPLEALSNTLPFLVEGLAPRIDSLSPTAGPAGSILQIHGARFADSPSANAVTIGGISAIVTSANPRELEVIVPLETAGGHVQVTTDNGTALSDAGFNLKARQDFEVAASQQSIVLPASGEGSIMLALDSAGLDDYDLPVSLRVSGLPDGVSATPSPQRLSRTRDVEVHLHGSAPAGTYRLRLIAEGDSEEGPIRREIALQLEILAPDQTAVHGRVVHADNEQGLAGVSVSLGDMRVTTDAGGNYLFIEPDALGDQVVLIDGDVLNTETEHFPSRIPLPVSIHPGETHRVLTAHLAPVEAGIFTDITPGRSATVTRDDIPGYALNIPEGVTMTGWDGEPIDRINVRQVHPDRLPIRPVPEGITTNSVYLYYFYRPGGAEPSEPIPVTMQNDLGLSPGDTAILWYYDETPEPDPDSNQWRVMGTATVSADGQRIVSDPGVGIPRFCCGASFATPDDPPEFSPGGDGDDCPGPRAGNPVDLATGAGSILADHSLAVGGDPALGVSIRYSSLSDREGPFGRGTYSDFEWRLDLSAAQATITSPDGVRYNLVRGDDGHYRQQTGRRGGFRMELEVRNDVAILHRDRQRLRFGRGGQMDGLLLGVDDAQGQELLRFIRDPDESARVTRISDHQGRYYQLSYEDDQVTEIRCPLGRQQQLRYDNDRLIEVHDFAGAVTRYQWQVIDARQQIVRRTDADGAVTAFEYLIPPDNAEPPPGADGNWSPQRVFGRISGQRLADGSEYRFEYTPDWRASVGRATVHHPSGGRSEHRFNSNGYVLRQEDPLGRVHEQTLDPQTNRVLSMRDPLGRVTRFSHDDRGNVTSITDPAGHVTRLHYHPRFDTLIRIIDPLGRETQLEYHPSGEVRRIVNPAGEATVIGRDARGRMISVTDANGHAVHTDHDSHGNVRRLTDAIGRSHLFEHDQAGRLLRETDPAGRTRHHEFDAMDRLISTRDGGGSRTEISYTETGRIASVRDAKGALIETNSFDLRGRLVKRRGALGGESVYTYDAEGNVTEAQDARGETTTLDYDLANRLTTVTHADGRTIQFTYDQADRLIRVVDSEQGEHRYAYDMLDRLIRETSNQGMIEYAWDAAGQLVERRINGQTVTTYSHDLAGRISEIEHDGEIVRHQYDPAGRLLQTSLPNGIVQRYQYDPAGQVLAIDYDAPDGSSLDRIEYSYNAAGERINRDHEHGHSPLDTAFEAEYDDANRLVRFNGHALDYDANGNLTSRETDSGTVIYEWDSRNQLVGINAPDYTAGFAYDYMGRRVYREVNGEVTHYLYQGMQAVAELDESGSIASSYHGGLMLDQVFARHAADGNTTLLRDALGSVIALADDDGHITRRYHYSAYGETSAHGAPSDNPLQFTGRENDGTGLYHYRARYYAPDLNRFISPDPIGLLAGDPNFYRYVFNDPLGLVDPLGLWSVSIDYFVGYGGGITIGRNSDNDTWFVSGRIGLGVGAGVNVDLLDDGQHNRISGAFASSCTNLSAPVAGTSIGGYHQFGATFGMAYAGMQSRGGFNADGTRTSYNESLNPNSAIDPAPRRMGISFGGSAGIEVLGWW